MTRLVRFWPFALLGLLAGIYPALVIGVCLSMGSVRR